MDKNKDGLVDYNEATRGRWRLRGPRVCQLAFLKECDEDQSKSVSLKEWLNCFKITPGENLQKGEIPGGGGGGGGKLMFSGQYRFSVRHAVNCITKILECKMVKR